ncbi:MAG: alpha/beta fold hydrolase [Acidobacteria bacterium]|nr:alpha/beta fold hydrolase [Acidobacteriota bacterium]
MLVLAGLLLTAAGGLFLASRPAQSADLSGPVGPPGGGDGGRADFGKLPMSFEINRGQTDESVKYLAHGPNYNLYLTAEQAVMTLYRPFEKASAGDANEPEGPAAATVTMKLEGGRPAEPNGADELEGTVNYILGNRPEDWKTNIATYGRVRYAGVYEGIDLVYYGNQNQLEYDFIVAPHADPRAIEMRFDGAEDISIDGETGALVIKTAIGEIRQHAPVIYQEANGARRPVDGRYRLFEPAEPDGRTGNRRIGFELGEYDPERPLVIDPVLLYSSYLGGSQVNPLNAYGEDGGVPAGDGGNALAVDENGFAYLAGVVHSTDFPTLNGVQSQCRTDIQNPVRCFHAFVARFSQNGGSLVYATYLGGRVGEFGLGYSYAQAIAVDKSGSAYVTGRTTAPDFPTTPGSFQSTPAHPTLIDGAFVTKLNPNGSMNYSTFLNGNAMSVGGGRSTAPRSIAVDSSGNAYIVGRTTEPDFPTRNGFQPNCLPIGTFNICYTAGFLAKLDATGANLLYSSYIGSAQRVRGGTEPGVTTQVNDVAVDDAGNAYVVGATNLQEFPLRKPLAGQGALHDRVGCFRGNIICSDGFVMKIRTTAAGASSLAFSSFLGAVGEDVANGVALDPAKNVLVAGYTISPGFPVTPNAYDATCGTAHTCNTETDGVGDAFVTKIDPKLANIVYSTFFGGDNADSASRIKTDQSGRIYLTGSTYSVDFPTTVDAFQSSLGNARPAAFVTRFAATGESEFSSYLHGTDNAFEATYGNGIAVDAGDNIYLTGSTSSYAFPVRNAFQATHRGMNEDHLTSFNAFVTKIGDPTPVIFIPGVSGSFLNDAGSAVLPERWLGFGTDHRYLTLDQTSPFYRGGNIYAPDVIRRVTVDTGVAPIITEVYGPLLEALKNQGGYVEYDVNDDPLRRTTGGCDVINQQNRNPSLFVLAYDWRQDNEITANQRLADYVQCIQQFYGANTKVNIVTHSMGSLIARRYILDHPGKVKKLITVGAPWLGGPKLINVLETGQFLDSIGQKLVIAGDETFRFLTEDYPAAHQLIPTRSFFALGGRPYYERDSIGNYKIYNTYDDFVARLNELHPRTRPGDNDRVFHDFPGQDDWRNDTSGVQYYHIIGVQAEAKTINRVQKEAAKKICSVVRGMVVCRTTADYTLYYTTGDGTVPRLSAERKANGNNLNAPNARLAIFTTPSDELVDHTGLNQNPGVIKNILTFLNEPTPNVSPFTRKTKMTTAPGAPAAIPPVIRQPAINLKFVGLSAVTAADDLGNSTAPLPNDPDFCSNVPGVSYRRLDSEVIALTVPTGRNLTVSFSMPNQPVMLEWTKGTDKLTTETGRYLDLSLPQNTPVRLTITTAGVQDLRYDSDGDGSFETVIDPTARTSGANANDKDAPLVSFTETAPGGMPQLAIAATDAGSGVRSLMYSLDGTNFQPYAAPLSLKAGQTVEAFADDQNGNRSGTVSYQTGSFKIRIDGQIVDGDNHAVSGAVLNLTGPGNSLVTTQSVDGGIYSLGGLTAGDSYTLAPEHPDFTFTPASVPLANLAESATVNFTATRKTFNITGRVTDEDGNGAAGVSLAATGGLIATTDSNGDYAFFNLAAGEDYTITASKPYFEFREAALEVSELRANETVDFSGTQKKFGIGGTILDADGRGFGRISVTLSDGVRTFTTQTDESGLYYFDELPGGGDYTVTPSRNGAVFSPQSRSFNNLADDAEGDFTSPTSPNTWTGEVSSDWFNPDNWVGGAVPPGDANVTIPSGAMNEIVIGSNDVGVGGLTLEAGRTLTVGEGRTLSVANDANINGSLNGDGTFIGNGTTIFAGTSPQTSPTALLNNLTVSNPSAISLLGNVTVFGVLNLTDGVIDTGAFTLTLESAATVTRTGGFVAGALRKNFQGSGGELRKNAGAGSVFLFPVGTNTAGIDYSPLEANITSVPGFSGYLTVKVFDTVSPAPIAGGKISRYWQLDGDGLTTDLTFHYLAEDAEGIGNLSGLRVFRNGQSVCADDCVDEAALTGTATNVSSFSPWTIAQLAPTAANVAVAGRVSGPDGRGIANATVQLTDSAGTARTVKTNSFGYYRFDDVAVGQVLTLGVRHKAYRFDPRVVTVADEIENLDFSPVSPER